MTSRGCSATTQTSPSKPSKRWADTRCSRKCWGRHPKARVFATLRNNSPPSGCKWLATMATHASRSTNPALGARNTTWLGTASSEFIYSPRAWLSRNSPTIAAARLSSGVHQARLGILVRRARYIPGAIHTTFLRRLQLRAANSNSRPAERLVLDGRRNANRIPGAPRRWRRLHGNADRSHSLEEVGHRRVRRVNPHRYCISRPEWQTTARNSFRHERYPLWI